MKIYPYGAYCHECKRKAFILWDGKCWRHSKKTEGYIKVAVFLLIYVPLVALSFNFVHNAFPWGLAFIVYVITWTACISITSIIVSEILVDWMKNNTRGKS